MALFLGLDTSNYTTSAAVYDSENNTIRQDKKLLPVKNGEKGLRQSDAVFHHTVQLPDRIEALGLPEGIAGIGVSTRPRSVDGSYMPCFLVGEGTARMLGAALHVPVYRTSHQIGHILAALFSAGKLDLLREPFIAFHVS
ncbi:MAG: peptidase M22, partial [Oscillospiraceae bacterium]|nr:peptidase M22 [Oscillospiraceae bacterium]